MSFDKRLTPARPDLAARHLEGSVTAARFAEGRRMRVAEAVIGVRGEPNPEASLQTQALFGEQVMIYDEHEGWAWGQLLSDGYVGYFSANALRSPVHAATHRVAVPRSFIWPGPSIKYPVLHALPMGAVAHVLEFDGVFARLVEGGYAFAPHLNVIASQAPDFVAIAETFLHVPYLWGGKTSEGLDCSGLAQISLQAAGISAPRDSDMLEAAIGQSIEVGDNLEGLQRGDLVFWRGHVGIMRDEAHLLHANGHDMMVVSETLRQARDRIRAKSAGAITSVRRI